MVLLLERFTYSIECIENDSIVQIHWKSRIKEFSLVKYRGNYFWQNRSIISEWEVAEKFLAQTRRELT